MHRSTVKQLSDGLSRGDYSSREVTQAFLQRIDRIDPSLNSFITVTAERALAAADVADAARRAGNTGPLSGIPYANKDIFCTQGVRTTCGSKMLSTFVAPYDATVVERLTAAGLVMLGKTNMDEFAMGSSTETSFYGPTRNPWDIERVPGGSSGGSAAAVAAGLTPAATGTDTGGSIRQPAAMCGITGLKPSYGLVSRYGMIAYASSLDQGGPMTKTAEDAALLLNVMAGVDTRDSTSANRDPEDYVAALTQPSEPLRVGLPLEYFEGDLDPSISAVIDSALEEFKELGLKFSEVSLPHTHLSIPAYYVVAPAECSSNLARYDGVRYGHRCTEPKDIEDLYKRSRDEGFGVEVKRRIMIGTYALSAGYYDAYYLQAQKIRRLISEDFTRVFADVDVLLTPVTPSVAFKLGEKALDPIDMYRTDIYTTSANLAGLPALALPVGFVDGLPVGVQLVGGSFQESRLLNIAHQFQLRTDWHMRTPAEPAAAQ